MTDPNILKKASPARDTWMKHCDVRLFMSSEYNATFPTVGLNVSAGRKHIASKSKASWRYIYEHHRDDADFFMKADPDSFVIIDNLKEYLRHCNSSEPYLVRPCSLSDYEIDALFQRFLCGRSSSCADQASYGSTRDQRNRQPMLPKWTRYCDILM